MLHCFRGVIIVQKKETNDVLEQLVTAKSFAAFAQENADEMISEPLSAYLQQLLREKNVPKAEVIRRAEMNEICGYQIFSGRRLPSRDKVIALGLGFPLDLDGMQQLLKYAGMAPLYPKNKRDALIIFGICHAKTVVEINNGLFAQNMETLN